MHIRQCENTKNMRTKTTVLLSLLLLTCANLNAQVYELGIGGVMPGGFPNGVNIHGFGGVKFGRKFVLGISADYVKLNSQKTTHPLLIDNGSFFRPKIHPDTFQNVEEENLYSFFEMAIEPRFYKIKDKSRFFFCPSIGLGFFQQINNFSQVSKDYYAYGTFRAFNPFFGIELGKEYQLKKNKNLAIQFGVSSKLYFGRGIIYDAYSAPFTKSKIIFKGRLGIVYRL